MCRSGAPAAAAPGTWYRLSGTRLPLITRDLGSGRPCCLWSRVTSRTLVAKYAAFSVPFRPRTALSRDADPRPEVRPCAVPARRHRRGTGCPVARRWGYPNRRQPPTARPPPFRRFGAGGTHVCAGPWVRPRPTHIRVRPPLERGVRRWAPRPVPGGRGWGLAAQDIFTGGGHSQMGRGVSPGKDPRNVRYKGRRRARCRPFSALSRDRGGRTPETGIGKEASFSSNCAGLTANRRLAGLSANLVSRYLPLIGSHRP